MKKTIQNLNNMKRIQDRLSQKQKIDFKKKAFDKINMTNKPMSHK